MKIKRVSDVVARRFKIRLCHVSDTHGGFPHLHGRYDYVLHTGDFFPNSHHVVQTDKTKEMKFQLQWLRDNIYAIKQWLNGHIMIYVPGNHDFLHPDTMEYELQAVGVEAYGIANRLFMFRGVNFYGFPYVPTIDGTWNYEKDIPEMQVEVDKMVDVLNTNKVDVLCCHAPMHGCLDLTYGNELMGSTVIANALDYKVNQEMVPKYYLCGHDHEGNGLALRNGVLVSNAATTYQIIEVI
jgi:Icc-related predicted phosphoesterase